MGKIIGIDYHICCIHFAMNYLKYFEELKMNIVR